MLQFTVSMQVSDQRISDVLCAAFEDPSVKWYQIEEKVAPTVWEFDTYATDTHVDGKKEGYHYQHDYALNPGGSVLIRDTEEDTVLRLNAEALQRGLAVLALRYPHHLADIMNENEDATTGDAFLQCCLLGDILYS